MPSLDGRTVLVTGATDGLGRALARNLTGRGACVLVHGRDPDRARAVAGEAGAERAYVADLASLAEVRRLAADVAADHEALDVLVSNAGDRHHAARRRRAARERRRPRAALRGQLPGRLAAHAAARAAAGRAPRARGSSTSPRPARWRSTSTTSCSSVATAACAPTARASWRRSCRRSTWPSGWPATASPPTRCTPRRTCRRRWSPTRGPTPSSTIDEGVEATARLAADPALDNVSGRYFDGLREARADPQAYDADARRRLWALSERLTGLDGSAR